MKRHLSAAAALMLVAVACSPLKAQEQDRQPGAQQDWGRMMLEGMKEELQLTAEQQTRIEQILEIHRQATRNWWNENEADVRALREDLKTAQEAKDEEAIKAAEAKLRERIGTQGQQWRNLITELSEVLTQEQRDKARQLLQQHASSPSARLLLALRRLNLTKEQQAKAEQILRDARAEADKVQDPKEKAKKLEQALKAAVEKIRKEVLTDKQREELAKLEQQMAQWQRRGRGDGRDIFRGLDLSEEQKAKIAEMQKKARDEAAKAETPDAGREIVRAANKKIIEEVLTDEQRQKLRQQFRGGRGAQRTDREKAAE